MNSSGSSIFFLLIFIFLLSVFQAYSSFLSREMFLEKERAAGTLAGVLAGEGIVRPDSLSEMARVKVALVNAETGENLTWGDVSGEPVGAGSRAVLILEEGRYRPGRIEVHG